MAPIGTCASVALALAVVIVGGVEAGMLPALGVAVGVVALVALVALVVVGDAVAVGRPPGVDGGTFGEAMVVGGVAMGVLMVTLGVCAARRNATDREGAAPAMGTANSASNVAPSARTRETIRPADAAAEG